MGAAYEAAGRVCCWDWGDVEVRAGTVGREGAGRAAERWRGMLVVVWFLWLKFPTAGCVAVSKMNQRGGKVEKESSEKTRFQNPERDGEKIGLPNKVLRLRQVVNARLNGKRSQSNAR